jgi:hypothetical protein
MNNLPVLLQKGIILHDLFSSNVFTFNYDYDEWPTTHTDPDTYIRPYNGSLFRLRENYKSVFNEENFKAIEDMMDEGQAMDMTKVYKIKYCVNLLPAIGEYIQPESKEQGT